MHLSENIHRKFSPTEIKTKSRAKPKLTKAIALAARRPHIYIYAPSGFGKSASVLHWLKGIQDAKAWLLLTENDNNPDSFYEHLTAAFLSVRPDSEALIERLRGEDFDNFHHLAIRSAYYLIDLSIKTYVIMDSFEHITDEPLIESLVSIIREHTAYSFIVIDRHEPHGLFSDLILRNLMSVIENDEVII